MLIPPPPPTHTLVPGLTLDRRGEWAVASAVATLTGQVATALVLGVSTVGRGLRVDLATVEGRVTVLVHDRAIVSFPPRPVT